MLPVASIADLVCIGITNGPEVSICSLISRSMEKSAQLRAVLSVRSHRYKAECHLRPV